MKKLALVAVSVIVVAGLFGSFVPKQVESAGGNPVAAVTVVGCKVQNSKFGVSDISKTELSKYKVYSRVRSLVDTKIVFKNQYAVTDLKTVYLKGNPTASQDIVFAYKPVTFGTTSEYNMNIKYDIYNMSMPGTTDVVPFSTGYARVDDFNCAGVENLFYSRTVIGGDVLL